MHASAAPSDSIVDRAYERIKVMAVSYRFKPGERINEPALARHLGISRTPLREALHRLNTEGLLTSSPGKGFFCRALDAREIYSLYEMRKILETGAVRLAVARASDADIAELADFLERAKPGSSSLSTPALAELDEAFHQRVMALSGNAEMQQVLRNINERIRFVRWIDIELADQRRGVPHDHDAVIAALRSRDADACATVLEKHIDRRQEQISAYIREAYAKIYVQSTVASPRGE
ncbi:GntR family transcriptional regulator [Achromobacter aloeverae]|uniref:GntR family transcriptional regulator n=1 Tax=Achromobacter aloeverae TaxID=1750518 RepID=A0A4Q1HCD7_9BURK|nr:GntR family transcriptional regulator [Achromobacter aloeverae]RXN83254.1 GntR family transcriptional regulator [Achromobacter aloeverae]